MNTRRGAAIGSLVFFVVAPVVVAGVVPWLIGGWEPTGEWWPPVRVVGAVLMVLGGGVLAHAFIRFVREGLGTPAPVAPTQHLVVGGIYRHVRNPMYVAVVAVIAGQGLYLGDPLLLAYAAVVCGATAGFVRWYEEPTLLARFGDEYAAYRRNVPGWVPRFRPWSPEAET